ncbi:hypothetical protein P7C73_g3349, partial [Tremellales sp. Uapishka_1]
MESTTAPALGGRRSWRAYFGQEISRDWTDIILLIGCFITGLLDSAIFNIWSCFVSMQTGTYTTHTTSRLASDAPSGNTIYLGLGVAGQPPDNPWRWAKSGVSILSFVLGSYFFALYMRRSTPLKRSTLVISTLSQATLVFISLLVSIVDIVPSDAGDLLPSNFIVLLPISLLAAQAGGQCVLSRILGFGEIPSVVITMGYCDLAMDEKLWDVDNHKRNRRLGSVACFLVGAMLGGFMTKAGGIEGVLWVVLGTKVGMGVLWMVWSAEDEEGRVRLD